MKIITIVTVLLLAITCPGLAGAKKDEKVSESYKRVICNEISNYVDALFYENPHGFGSITSCSYTDERLLIKSHTLLTQQQMKHFVLWAFSVAGALRNAGYILPDNTYVGYGEDCQVLATEDASRLQEEAYYGGPSGLSNAMLWASNAPKWHCPK